jgi:hypothetical protein
MLPRGIRTNNPLMIRPTADKWNGELAPVDGYCVFDTPAHGLRAGFRQLLYYQTKHGRRTVKAIIPVWAPSQDHNDVRKYMDDVGKRLNVGDYTILDLTSAPILRAFGTAIIWHENGMQPYTVQQINTGVLEALQ